jgi:hypothetical protein
MEQAVNLFTGDDPVTGLFCCVCGREEQASLMVSPDRCTYERLGGVICDDCCRACEYHGGCAERLAGIRRPESRRPRPQVPCPFQAMDCAFDAWLAFRRDPGSRAAFDNCDWLLRVASAKWEAYALDRRVSQ